MLQEPLPQKIESLSDDAVHELITSARRKLGDSVVILGHHYQRDEVIRHADFTGDSLKLARCGRDARTARHIIFCGVHFMAETADILAAEGQSVSLPDLQAGCDMADMAETADVRQAWKDAEAAGLSGIVPVTYINSKASLKAFVGDHGGAICTSGNARQVVTWALEQGKHLFFFPDQHLGRNICKQLGLDPAKDMLMWDPEKFLGGNTPEALKTARVWLWKGHCPVHALFGVHHIERLRKESPETKILVHPECAMEIVDRADLSGSTEFIIKTVKASPAGSSWAIGTEKHLVERLAAENPDKKIVSLNPYTCLCGTMNRISARNLAWVLDDLANGLPLRNPIKVPENIAKSATIALERMFALS